MLRAAAQPGHLRLSLRRATQVLLGAKRRKAIFMTLCLVAAGGLSFWQGTTYQHGIDQTLISQFAPAINGQVPATFNVPTSATDFSPPIGAGPPPGP